MNQYYGFGFGPIQQPKKRRKKPKKRIPQLYVNYGYGFQPVQQIKTKTVKRKKKKVVRQPTIGQDIAGIAKQWESRGKKVYKGYKQVKKASVSAYEAHKKRKLEGRDTMTLTKHYAGQVKQVIRPNRSIYYQKKKGIGSKLKGLFGKKKKGVYN